MLKLVKKKQADFFTLIPQMASKIVFFTWVFTFRTVSMVVLPSFTLASRPAAGTRIEITVTQGKNPQVLEQVVNGYYRMFSRFYRVSLPHRVTTARQVPTGPDPLHHNNSPLGPFP